VKLFEHDVGDAYFAAFSTRQGGVSEGEFESLNLGILTDDEPDRVVENRRILAGAVGADPETATMAWQIHGSRVFEADGRGIVTPGTDFEQGDGLWTEERGRALGLLTADCFPVVLARRNGNPRLVILHVGWRGLMEGILENGVAAAEGPAAAAIGPGIGPCCYEVGEEVAGPLRARFGESIMRGRNLDLAEAMERGLREQGVESVVRTGHCTSCEPELFFSHRRDRGRTGRQGVIAYIR
jgi:purine-nucleoside/S-methyl-5'-thioadenosine phosphorylase / adenosine deaminase